MLGKLGSTGEIYHAYINPHPALVFVKEMSSANYVFCIDSNSLQTSFFYHVSKYYEP